MPKQSRRKSVSPRIRAFFANLQTSTGLPETDSVLIVPVRDRWNDFGQQTRVEYVIRLGKPIQRVDVTGFLGVIDSQPGASDRRRIQELIDTKTKSAIPAPETLRYFTMLPDMEAYRRLVQLLGPEAATAALLVIHDLVALGEFDPSSSILKEAVSSKAFHLSFMRSSDTYFAYKNAGQILRGLTGERRDNLSPSIAVKFRLPGKQNDHDLQFNFNLNDGLPKRIAVVIGKNGVGKSQTLGRIARAAVRGESGLTDGTAGGRPLIGRLLAFAPTNETESVFPSDRRKRPLIWYRRFSLNRSRRNQREHRVTDMIVQLARSKQTIAGLFRWNIFIESLRAISGLEQIHLATHSEFGEFTPLRELLSGGEQVTLERFASVDVRRDPARLIGDKIYPLSSGEISFLKFAAQASLHIENGSLLLLDEPETHLHPNFINQFASMLNSLLQATGSAAIVATHSAYFVREVFREQVTVLSVDSNCIVHALQPNLQTFGADVGAISYFVFGEDEPSSLAMSVKIQLTANRPSWNRLFEHYKGELSLELLNEIRAALDGN